MSENEPEIEIPDNIEDVELEETDVPIRPNPYDGGQVDSDEDLG